MSECACVRGKEEREGSAYSEKKRWRVESRKQRDGEAERAALSNNKDPEGSAGCLPSKTRQSGAKNRRTEGRRRRPRIHRVSPLISGGVITSTQHFAC